LAPEAKISTRRPQRIETLDGIRGCAILMVLFLHAGWFNKGWVGVDLFFVLSGYLITGILRESRDEAFYWRRFYIKRATRIIPPLLVAIGAIVLLWPGFSWLAILGYLLSCANIVNLTRFEILPLRHLWSLSVEEHFYLFWPFAVLYLSKQRLQKVLIAIVAVAPIVRCITTYFIAPGNGAPLYFLTPFRMDEIALGCLLALLLEETFWENWLRKWAGAGFVLVVGAYLMVWAFLGHLHTVGNGALFNLIAFSLVAFAGFFAVAYARLGPDTAPNRFLQNRLLVKLGRISYGVYVYSFIILQLFTRYVPSLSTSQAGLIHIIVSVVFSAISFRYYEWPITSWGKRRAGLFKEKARLETAKRGPERRRQLFEPGEVLLTQRDKTIELRPSGRFE
jgi:peptidoglycan/LPS O-acetylase OafA/YrhL